ncbi:MAG: sulfonate transport system permease protein [Microbacteriaceae bacterium]|nr:nitrate/sulfonate/bicarbonate transporter permease [Microbacteriaceae bacterium]MDQ1525618.1 sulfonate transport system permease protein [Microbacteriaceae bacterium]
MPQQSSNQYDDSVAEGPGAPVTLSAAGSEYITGASVAAAPSAQVQPGRRRGPVVLLGAVVPILLLGVWQWVSASGVIPAYRLPAPSAVYLAAIDLAQRGLLLPDIQISTQRVLLGFAFGAVFGLVVGAIIGLSRWASLVFAPTIGGFRAVPSLAWVPLLILYLGINEDQKVLLIAIGAFFPVYTTVAGALRHVDRQLVEVGRAFGRRRIALLLTVQLPAILPTVVSGLRLALAQSWLFLVAAELIASSIGLGFLLKDSQDNGRIDRLFVAIILLALLGKATDAIIGLLERFLLRRWG